MISAALVHDTTGIGQSFDDGVGRRRAISPRFTHSTDDEDFVVHRESEQHREEEHRYPTLDLAHVVRAEQRTNRPRIERPRRVHVGDTDRYEVQQNAMSGSAND